MDDSGVIDNGQSRAGWLELGSGQRLFHWLHRPESLDGVANRNDAVIIAGPIGPEYMHCHRAIKRLAESLAAQGLTSLRFDPLGYGNSSGTAFDPGLVDGWRDTLVQLALRLRERGGYDRIALVTLRSAVLIADRVLALPDTIDSLVCWYPYGQGAAFVRDMGMIDELIDSRQQDTAYINAGGYPLSRQSIDALSALHPGDFDYRVRRTLILRSGETSTRPGRLQRRLAAAGIECREIASGALPKMARQAELSELPLDDIGAITAWLAESGSSPGNQRPDWPRDRQLAGEDFVETLLQHDQPRHLFGILCRPASGDDDRPLVVLGNIGAGHHVGPNRLNVDLARSLARVGLTSVRFDLANLGDSPAPGARNDNHPYPPTAVDDIDTMLTALEPVAKARRYVLAGLCSGAWSAFHAQRQLANRAIVETILINPLTFYLQEGESIIEPEAAKSALRQNYYRDQARNWRTWMRLLGNPRKVLSIAGFVVLLLARKTGRLLQPLARALGMVEVEPLSRDIEAILAQQRRLTFIVSAGDPGYQMIMDGAAGVIRDGIAGGQILIERTAAGDHTFSTLDSRRELIDFIVAHLDSSYRPGDQAGG